MTKRFTFRKLELHEKIRPCDFHSMDNGATLNPIINQESIGESPKDFSTDRSFWRVIAIED
jgi:hypothetical protein